MAGLAFDTHKAVKALREAGADEPLAEAVVVTIGDAFGENITTKTDLGEVKAELKADVAAVRAELGEVKTELGEVKAELKADVAAVRAELGEVKAELKADVAAVRTELGEVKTELKADVAAVRTELKADVARVRVDLAEMETRLYRHLWAMAVGIVGLTVSLTVALVKLTS